MSKKHYGWAEMPVMGYIEASTNVRPIVKQCYDENKSSILHLVLATRYSACGASHFVTSFLDINNRSSLIEDPEMVGFDIGFNKEKVPKSYLVCPECLESKEWKEYMVGRERERNGKI